MNKQNVASLEAARARLDAEASAAVTVRDFYAYMPMHEYIFTPTREFGPLRA